MKFKCRVLSIHDIVSRNDKQHIQLTEVPKAYFSMTKSINGHKIDYYDNLLQITERNYGMIFDLDTTPI